MSSDKYYTNSLDDKSNEIEKLQKMFFQNSSSVHMNQISFNYENIHKKEPDIGELSELSANFKNLTSSMKKSSNKNLSNDYSQNQVEIFPATNENNLQSKTDIKSPDNNHVLQTSLIETNLDDLEIQQADPNDPLYSVTSFKDLKLSTELLKGIISLGFRKPSGIQEKALPMLLRNPPKNLIAQSQSGTGKTATYLLTMLSRLDVRKNCCQCLCMAPTRELAIQIAEVAITMSKYMDNIKITCAIKGYVPNLNGNEVDAHIVIGTPGTIKYWTSDDCSIYINPRKVKVFVLDEADVLIENNEFLNISKRIKSKLTQNCQILLFSATYDDRVMEFAREFVPSFTEICVKTKELTLKNIKQYYIPMTLQEKKYETLIEIFGMKSIGQCIIFCESRRMAAILQQQLENDGHLSSLLSGDLDILMREQELNDFRTGKTRVLIATNICSRGIDIPQVNLIINWDMPRNIDGTPDCETYLHRIGRSGRFGKIGLTINFLVTKADKSIQDKIVDNFGTKIEEMDNLEIVASIK